MIFPYRHIARITLEAVTPLIIGGDQLIFDQDNPVDRDFNNLPYIPATALAGFFITTQQSETLYGDDKKNDAKQPNGSNIVFSDGYLLDSKEEITSPTTPLSEINQDNLLKHYEHLPLRQHTKINHLGAADDGSKFDQEFVYKGSRFKFEVCLETKDDKQEFWNDFLNNISKNKLFLGSGISNNFGELEIQEIYQKSFHLKKEEELKAFLNVSVDLNDNKGFEIFEKKTDEGTSENENTKEGKTQSISEIKIELDGSNSFFHFGSGLADDEIDDTNYSEQVIEGWKNNKPVFVEKFVIPGTSIKGALAHRTAFHYNKLIGKNIESILNELPVFNEEESKKYNDLVENEVPESLQALENSLKEAKLLLSKLDKKDISLDNLYARHLSEQNDAVAELFGTAKNTKENKNGSRGQLIVKDIYLKDSTTEKIFMHNKIDRFTQGTIDGALFGEKALIINQETLIIQGKKKLIDEISDIKTKTLEEIESLPSEEEKKRKKIIKSFQRALEDLENGLLPLGGKTSRGHGVFKVKKICYGSK